MVEGERIPGKKVVRRDGIFQEYDFVGNKEVLSITYKAIKREDSAEIRREIIEIKFFDYPLIHTDSISYKHGILTTSDDCRKRLETLSSETMIEIQENLSLEVGVLLKKVLDMEKNNDGKV